MTARCFKLEIAGEAWYGVAFQTEAERETFLGVRGIVLVDQLPGPRPPADDATERDTGGRPSSSSSIERAVEELGPQLEEFSSIAAKARLVRDHMGAAAPAQRTVETFLSAYLRPTTQKPLPQKLRRA